MRKFSYKIIMKIFNMFFPIIYIYILNEYPLILEIKNTQPIAPIIAGSFTNKINFTIEPDNFPKN